MRARNIVVYALAAVLLAMLLITVCEIARCERARVRPDTTGGVIKPLTPAGSPTGRTAENGPLGPTPELPSSQTPKPARRPVFGTERTEGVELVVPVNPAKQPDTVRLFVRRDLAVVNPTQDTVLVGIQRVGPAWIQWDPGFGAVVMGWLGRRDKALVPELRGVHLDVAGKLKLVDICPALGLEVGLPVIYVGTAGPGVGFDLKHDALEWLALDAGWFPFVQEWQVGVSVSPFPKAR